MNQNNTWIIDELMEWQDTADAYSADGARQIIAEYERRKSLWQRIKAVFRF